MIAHMVGDAVLQALARLYVDPDFQKFLDEVKSLRDEAHLRLETATDPWLAGRAQGAAILAGDLISLAQGARASLAKRQVR
jgi:hypothetical protein